MTITSDFLKEDVDFALEEETNPGEGEMEFNVRLLTGAFVETLIGFKNLRMIDDPEDEEEFQLAFDFAIKSTPDPELTEKNSGFQCLRIGETIELKHPFMVLRLIPDGY